MIWQHARSSFFFTFVLITGFLIVGCGSRSTQVEDSEVNELDDTPVENPIDAPIPIPSGTPVPLPTPQYSQQPGNNQSQQWDQLPMEESFGQWNNVMRRCRPHMGGQKDKIIKWLLAILEGTSFGQTQYGGYNTGIPSIYYDSRGFQASSRGGGCMKGLKKRLQRFQNWENQGYFQEGTVGNWVAHSTDWTYGYNNSPSSYGYSGSYGNGYNYNNGYTGSYPYGYSMGQ